MIMDDEEEQEKLIEELELLKAKFNIEYEVLSDKESRKYWKEWIDNILPVNVSEETRAEAYKYCLPSNPSKMHLWNLFNFEIIETMDNPTKRFNYLIKRNYTLVFESNNFITVKFKNAEDLEEQDIIDFCKSVSGWGCCDFVITADDFSWSYSRTHEDYEDGFGPYFYKKKKEQC
ncbi:MAG: DUF4275 family protein [Eubacterium sp.]|nr:DUF4275 family protein [Eubacterium sp.]